ncbi:helix-turn-helix domain-containing protein [Actinoallomurus purpureus]|uniref:helix-turn-helix domain-containing protein n=1 Tax=Actinoallomurus purpureus TaxID=478114 RepID=UPI0020936CE2|nr:helix-turn-helix domain-containing protein [Actinoallomurus purpureus]MCO6010095.1 helix-turn-helix domain-containing protein [Actinoallomurus purpureus]
MGDGLTIGERVAKLRRQRHLTQAELAERSGVSVDLIRKLEQNQRRSTRIGSLQAIAGALDVQVSALLDGPTANDASNAGAGISELRRALTPAGRSHIAELPTETEVRLSADEAWRLHQCGDYVLLARVLPDLIDGARIRAQEEPGDSAYRLLAEAYQLAAMLLLGIRSEDLACVAADRLQVAADNAGDSATTARAADTWAWIYSRQGRLDDAQGITLKAADKAEPARFGSASPEDLSVWCGLLQRGVMVASRKDDADMVDDLISLAGAVGRRIGDDRIDQWTVSGPTNVAMHAVRSAVELGDPRKALRLADDVPPSASLPTAWCTRHLLDVAHAQYAVKRDEEAASTLLRIDRRAPGWLPYQGVAREIVTEMRRREPPSRIRGLRQLVEAIGIDE